MGAGATVVVVVVDVVDVVEVVVVVVTPTAISVVPRSEFFEPGWGSPRFAELEERSAIIPEFNCSESLAR